MQVGANGTLIYPPCFDRAAKYRHLFCYFFFVLLTSPLQRFGNLTIWRVELSIIFGNDPAHYNSVPVCHHLGGGVHVAQELGRGTQQLADGQIIYEVL